MVRYVSCLTAEERHAARITDDADIMVDLSRPGQDAGVAIDRVTTIYPAYAYHRPSLQAFGPRSAGMQEVLAAAEACNRSATVGPPTVLALVGSARLHSTALYAGGGTEDFVVHESCRSAERWKIANGLPDAARDTLHDGSELCFWLGSLGSHDYAYWLVEDAPRLKGMIDLAAMIPNAPIRLLLPGHGDAIDRIRRETIYLVVPGHVMRRLSIDFIDWNAHRVDRLYYVTPCSDLPHGKSPAAVRWLRHEVRVRQTSTTGPRRIFIEPGTGAGQGLINVDEVRAFLARFGFVSVSSTGMDFFDRAEFFAKADFIVGCMGTAIVDAMFARDKAKVGMLAPDGWAETFHWDLAAVLDQPYAACYGASGEMDRAPHTRHFTIDLADLRDMLLHLSMTA